MSPPFEAVIEGQRREIERLRAINAELLAALEGFRLDIKACHGEIERLRARKAELLACLTIAYEGFAHDDDGPVWADSLMKRTRAAIKKAKEQLKKDITRM